MDPAAAGVQCGHANHGAAPPSQGRPLHSSSGSNAPSKGPQRIHHTPGVHAAKPKRRRTPQAGRPLRDGPRGQGTKPPQAGAPSRGPRCTKATPRQTDAAGHHSHMRAQRHPVLISSNRGPATRFRDDGKTARQLRGGRTNQYGDRWRRDGRGAPPRGLGHSTRQTTTNQTKHHTTNHAAVPHKQDIIFAQGPTNHSWL